MTGERETMDIPGRRTKIPDRLRFVADECANATENIAYSLVHCMVPLLREAADDVDAKDAALIRLSSRVKELEEENQWSTDVKSAPRGEDVLIAVLSVGGQATTTQMGMLLWEPADREDGDTDDDIEGYWGELDGRMGMWRWNASDEDWTDKKDIVAWRPMPPEFRPLPAPPREI